MILTTNATIIRVEYIDSDIIEEIVMQGPNQITNPSFLQTTIYRTITILIPTFTFEDVITISLVYT